MFIFHLQGRVWFLFLLVLFFGYTILCSCCNMDSSLSYVNDVCLWEWVCVYESEKGKYCRCSCCFVLWTRKSMVSLYKILSSILAKGRKLKCLWFANNIIHFNKHQDKKIKVTIAKTHCVANGKQNVMNNGCVDFHFFF